MRAIPGKHLIRPPGAKVGFSPVTPTVHPSSIVRIPGSAERDEAYASFVKDLQVAAALLS